MALIKKKTKWERESAMTADAASGETVSAPTPSSEDFAIQAATNSSPYGFVTADEADSLIALVVNLRARVNELEAIVENHGLANSN